MTSEELRDLAAARGALLRRVVLGILRDPDRTDEVLQDVWMRCLQSPSPLDTDRRRAWVYRVAVNEALQARRRQGRMDRVLDVVRADQVRRGAAIEQRADGVDVEAARSALSALPAEQRAVVELRLGGKSFAEIAELQGTPLGTALTRMRLALAKLRTLLGGER